MFLIILNYSLTILINFYLVWDSTSQIYQYNTCNILGTHNSEFHQVYEWNRTWGDHVNQYGISFGVAVYDNNSIYITGDAYAGNIGYAIFDVLLVKYDSIGNQIWNRTCKISESQTGSCILVDANNDVYIAGANYTQPPSSKMDILVVKYDSAGNNIWNRTWDWGGDDWGGDIVMDTNNFIYVGGVTSNDLLLLKYDSAGNYIWNRTWGGSNNEEGYGVAVDNDNYIYITGQTYSFGSGSADAVLVKYDSAGNQIWNKTWGGVDPDVSYDVAIDDLNNIYITGKTNSYGGGHDILLAKFDSSGNQIWNKTWGLAPGTDTDVAYGVEVDSYNYVYLTGYYHDYSVSDNEISFFIKCDSGGNMIRNQSWTANGMDSIGYDVALSNDNSVYIAGDNGGFPFIMKYGIDSDNDGLSDYQERDIYGTNPNNSDTDGDFMPDGWEVRNLLDPLNPSDSSGDSDSDGLSNLGEYNNATDPNDSDTDNDLMPDGWEVDNNLDPLEDDSPYDDDGDALSNLLEYQNGTDPNDEDTDDDGLNDYAEVTVYDTDPTNPDTDNDGYSDGAEIQAGSDPLNSNSVPFTFFEKYGIYIVIAAIAAAIIAVALISRHSIQAKKFRIFVSHAVKDFEDYRVSELARYLESQKEISHAYFCEEDLVGNIDDWMRKTVPRCQLLIFFATEKSLKSEDCIDEIKIARKNGIQIRPVLGVNLEWEDLEDLNINRELGERYDPLKFKSFCEKVYGYVLKYKEDLKKDSIEKKQNKKFQKR